jgi:hypothetical protein
LQPALLLSDMFSALDRLLAKARSGLLPHSAIHVRLYYLARFSSDDGVQWRTSLQSAVASWDNKKGLYAATTVVPVQGISLINSTAVSNESSPFLAMQVLVIDPVHMETEQLVFNARDEFL